MTWVPLLLADPSANLRLLVLRELLGRPQEDPEVIELDSIRESDHLLQDLLALQNDDGSWRSKVGSGESWMRIRSTSHALLTLGYLGYGPQYLPVAQGIKYLFSLQLEDGSWPIPKSKAERELREQYSMIPLQTGIPLRAIAATGYAADPRAEKAYEWLLGVRLPDGAWPSGIQGGQNVFPAGYRRLSHSRFGCRTNTTFAISALAYHPSRKSSPETSRALDLLLAQETQQKFGMGQEIARMIGVQPRSGFFTYFARNDAALLLDLCWRIGASIEDERVEELVAFVRDLQGPYGLWDYQEHPEATRWVSFDLLRSLSRIDLTSEWVSLEPRTSFQPYPKKDRRY